MDQVEAHSHEIAAQWQAAMRRGDFEGAWQQTDRIEIPRRSAERLPGFVRSAGHLRWNGEPLAGRDVLVRCEHGLGDTLQFVRFLPRVRELARSATLLVQPALLGLLGGASEFGAVRNGWSGAGPPHDIELEVMELAYAFRSTADTIPRDVPYLPLAPLREVAKRLPAIPRDGTFNVGLAWGASGWDEARSIPLDALASFGDIPGVRFYSLQQGPHREGYARAPFPIEPYSQHTEAIEAAAAAMLDLDLVITVDSMVAHLAGALARPVWVLLRERADWRWIEARDDTPWYPTMRLMRQSREGDWRGVAARAAEMLRDAVSAR